MKSALIASILEKYGTEETHRDGEDQASYDKRMVTAAFFVMKLTRVDSNPIKVIDSLWIGSIGSAYSPDVLTNNSISKILCVAESPKLMFPDRFCYLRVSMLDDPIKLDAEHLRTVLLPECLTFIKAAIDEGCNVLVHCFLGVSRSAFVCCAYIMLHSRLRLWQALEMVRAVRPMAQPNSLFMQVLRSYDSELFGNGHGV